MRTQPVYDWMTHDPITINSDAPLLQARRLMRENAIRCLPVMNNGEFVGIVTLDEVCEALVSETISHNDRPMSMAAVSTIVTRVPFAISPLTTISLAAQIMLEHRISGLPVMVGDKLIGIITEGDILRMLLSKAATSVSDQPLRRAKARV